ncbi:class I SAM-dependent methyltransferase [Rhodobacter capsulatus]|uniref:Methyltransferase domain-containing protein n=1 Tax=Rhodobacter capsulatus TaxID=1061 RepID=A0A1G7QLP9_RHOCA|nr:class I SAM-dependent methyltransferase [Rhodobacter capsulatus]WER08442.1 class I SAM-dependent methyltransferase [Rhodobacter capsulatus]SDF99436.1 Methyltransferase domain-containing protein [Rhodobacter capsulatus]
MHNPDRNEYWNNYYSRQTIAELSVPSQFAAFVANEIKDAAFVVDIASGSGRDSFFFARYFPSVLGVDQATSAIQRCRDLCEAHSVSNLRFETVSAVDGALAAAIRGLRAGGKTGAVLVYARFFLHAITSEEEQKFFDALEAALEPGDHVALEYRTIRDASNVKSTPDHYRRFVQPSSVLTALEARGFSVDYSVEGFGLAKYKQDDAYIARSLHRKR